MWILSKAFVNSLSSPAQVADSSADIYLVGEPSAPWKSSLTRRQSLSGVKTTDSLSRSLFGMISVRLMELLGAEKLMWYREVSHAKTFLAPGKAQESTANEAGFGVKCTELSARYDRATHSWKTAHCLFEEDLAESSLTLPKSGMMQRGRLLALTMSERRTSESECGYSPNVWIGTPTPMARMQVRSERFRAGSRLPTPAEFARRERFLTPQASDGRRSEMKLESLRKRYMKHPQGNLAEQIAMFPTPTVHGNYNRKGLSKTSGDGLATFVKKYPTPRTKGMCGGTGNFEQMKKLQEQGVITDEERRKMTAGNGGALNPDWVEWLMAFPIGWTDLKPLAMRKFLSWRRSLSAALNKF